MDFNKATKSCCEKIMSCQENSMKFELKNSQKSCVKLYEVDGNLIKDIKNKKCDYMYEVFKPNIDIKTIDKELDDDDKISGKLLSSIYVELKGKNFERAVEQLEVTATTLKKRHMKCKDKLGVIVCSRIQHPRFSTLSQKLKVKMKRDHKVSLTITTKQCSHSV
ncbi:hypothetical protein SE23_20525 [Vibrio sinaloensis]|uniref:hypothetical protein n=1 Tax=Photobacterium sp. (strain ATCC 43367) TaxID=379097 RepID=UPI00057FDA06|nr:hypothetical protein [Vibrio sinaloensis]KIE18742.1 hypothetical protein SE23_20525 [Vibrio sinaloensis]